MKCLVLLCLVFVFKNFHRVASDCVLSLNKDFGSPQPVFVRGDSLLSPNSPDGTIFLSRSDTLLVACTGERRYIVLDNDTTDFNTVKAVCLSNTTFQVGDWTGELKDVRCNTQPWFTTEDTGKRCYGGRRLYRVGYVIDEVFYKLYEACFDGELLTTLYVKHELTPANRHFQNGGSRPQFLDGDMFNNIKINNLYKMASQKDRFNYLLGKDMDKEYLTKNQFLTRGHLAARADFPLRVSQRASFHYINAAPQWIRGNAGDWAALEEALRRRIASYNGSVTVYTGTYGVCTLGDRNGVHTELYLGDDQNNNRVVPVPMYFYKMVHDPKKRTATAFVSINSPYYNGAMLKDLTFCSDLCDGNRNYSWLKWRANDNTHSFCCDYDEFIEKIDHLPSLKINGMFY